MPQRTSAHAARPVTVLALLAFVVFVITTSAYAASTETTLHTFLPYSRGSGPQAGLVSDGAGNFYGTTQLGGAFGAGTVFKLTSSGGAITESVLYSFTGGTDGGDPLASLVLDSGGNLYGTTLLGGNTKCLIGQLGAGCGTVFELSPNPDGTWTEKTLHTFAGADGGAPIANLAFDAAGNLFGTTEAGGTSQFLEGTAFELSPAGGGTWTFKTIHNFQGGFGSGPNSGLIFDKAGNLYGTALGGGMFGRGVVFELSPSGQNWSESVLYSFNKKGGDGNLPVGGVNFDSAGSLYGATNRGGSNGFGVVYRLTPSGGTWTETVLYNFQNGADGGNPQGSVIVDSAGNLYGTTNSGGTSQACSAGCGVAYELVLNSGAYTETILHTFNGGKDGALPYGNLLFDSSGALWGTTSSSGTSGAAFGGIAFRLTPSGGSWSETAFNFPATDGSSAVGKLVLDSKGNLYGTTFEGGAYGVGAVFALTPVNGHWRSKLIYSFQGSADGAFPRGGLISDSAGNLYGETGGGGTCATFGGCGTVFEVLPLPNGRWRERVLYSFQNSPDGLEPSGGLALDSAGNLYGATINGGSSGFGTVFMLTPGAHGSWAESRIYSFSGSDGHLPLGGVTLDSAGNVYGTTAVGGVNSQSGTVFEISPAQGTWTLTRQFTFKNNDPGGAYPASRLLLDQAGNLYGTTEEGGFLNNPLCSFGCGVAFQLTPTVGTWTETVLYTFGTFTGDAVAPDGGLLMDSAGNLFGKTSVGGILASPCLGLCGTVYELTPSNGTWSETIVYGFTGSTDGGMPSGDLIFDSAGNLYGVTAAFGAANAGTVFKVTP
ncbi:MAG: hypothetical protein LAO03_23235 [Acidobacteriia bacterium]|nr:hypothetical protein [Terriglobia bacterium]